MIDLSVQWMALFHGAFVGEIHFEQPVLNFVNAPSKEDSQVGLQEPWTQKIKQLFPLKINRFTVSDGDDSLPRLSTGRPRSTWSSTRCGSWRRT